MADKSSGLRPGKSQLELLQLLRGMLLEYVAARGQGFVQVVEKRLFDQAEAASSQAEQEQLFDAMRRVRAAQGEVAPMLQQAVKRCFAGLSGDMPGVGDESGLEDGSKLQLVENEALEEMITLDTMVSRVMEASRPTLDHLTRRLNFLAGKSVQEQENPFVPEMLCERFADWTRSLELPFSARLLLFKWFDELILNGWPELVAAANELIRPSMLPDLESKRPEVKKRKPERKVATDSRQADEDPQPSQGTGHGDQRDADGTPASGTAAYDAGRQFGASMALQDPDRFYGDVLSVLHHLMHDHSASRQGAVEDEAFSSTTPRMQTDQLLSMLGNLVDEGSQQGLERLREGGLLGTLSTMLEAREQKQDGLRAIDQSILTLVDKTFASVNQWQALPEDLSHLMARLEVPAAAMALKDPQFLEKQNHPGRRLINELCRASSMVDAQGNSPDPLRTKIETVVDQLNRLDLTVKELNRILTDLVDFMERERRHQLMREQRVMEEEEAQARLSMAHGKVLQLLNERLVGRQWPTALVTFCEKAWCRVMFLSFLRHGQSSPEWQSSVQLLDQLLAQFADTDSPALNDALLDELRARLVEIGFSKADLNQYIDSLRSLAPVEQDEEVVSLDIMLPGSAPQPDVASDSLDHHYLDLVDALKKGAWMEFRDENGKALRCRFAGVINAASKFIFTNRKGAKVGEESRHRLAVKLQEGKVIVLDNSHLFDKAYQQVVDQIQTQSKL
ncbi:MAG: hypothetical protein CMK32_11780 [Porticoccaceae bacterium]|nr:hypothetical protein [Porticoccaceae bacterium]